MNICVLICGLPRSIDLVINNLKEKFKDHNISLYFSVCDLNDTNYINNFNIADLHKLNQVKNVLVVNAVYGNKFKNSLNYINKVSLGIDTLPSNYDLYIIQRSDLIIQNVDFLNAIKTNNLYFSNSNNIKEISDISGKINEQIIISKDYNNIKKLTNLFKYANANNNYSSICLYDFVISNNIKFELIDINYKLILSKCNIIAISGDSGSGKSTLMKKIGNIFSNGSVLHFETDRYHKWERGDENYNTYTHLNPEANHLELMSNDIYNLKIGNEIYQVDYDHDTGKFTSKEKISSCNNVILCGLHTLFNNSINNIIDIKIFMDTDRKLIKKWKIQRDTIERSHPIEKILKSIEKREPDYIKYIQIQKNSADIIINFFEDSNEIKCNLQIQNENITNKLSNYFIKYNYTILNNIIQLKKNIKDIYENEMISQYYPCDDLEDYYNEILILLIIYIYY